MADIKRYASVKPLTLATDLTSTGAVLKTTSKTSFNDEVITSSLFPTDYVWVVLQSDDRKKVEFMLVTAATILNIDTSGATIYKRGLKFTAQGDATDFDEVTANKLDWTAGETKVFIGTNPPSFYGSFTNRYNDETITAEWTFTNPKYPRMDTATPPPTDDEQFATKKYVDGIAIAGAPDASTTVKGISKLSTAPVSPTDPIAVGTNDTRMPTQGENDALVGRSGTPSASQPYETVHDSSNASTYTASTISFTASTKTIADSANGFVTANFIAGTQIVVTGSVSNNGTYTIVSVAAGAIVVAETLVNESAGASITLTSVTANKLVRYSSTSQVKVPLVPVATVDATSKSYVDGINTSIQLQLAKLDFTVNADETRADWLTTNIQSPTGTSTSDTWTFSFTPFRRGNGSSCNGNGTITAFTTNGFFNVTLNGTSNDTVKFNSNTTIKMKFCASSLTPSGTGGSQISSFIGFGTTAANSNGDITVATNARVGIAFYNGNVYIMSSNGTTVTSTSLGAYSQNLDLYAIILNGTTSAEFFINGSSVGTISTNIPSPGTNINIIMGGINSGGGAAGFNFVSNIILSQKTS